MSYIVKFKITFVNSRLSWYINCSYLYTYFKIVLEKHNCINLINGYGIIIVIILEETRLIRLVYAGLAST